MKIGGYLKETSYPACHQPEGQHSSPSFTTRHPFTMVIGLFVTAEEEDACHKINYGYIEVPFSQFSCMMVSLFTSWPKFGAKADLPPPGTLENLG